MSTASDTLRVPARASRTRIHSGVGRVTCAPCTSRSTNRSQAVGSAMLAGYTCGLTSFTSAGRPASAGSVNWAPNAIASSRATPRTDSAKPLSGVTLMSSTWSRSPAYSAKSAPSGASGDSTRIPEWSSPMASSAAEQIIPSDIRP